MTDAVDKTLQSGAQVGTVKGLTSYVEGKQPKLGGNPHYRKLQRMFGGMNHSQAAVQRARTQPPRTFDLKTHGGQPAWL